jgi:Tfp pilus assembly protein PilO
MKRSFYSFLIIGILFAAGAYVITSVHIPLFTSVYKKVQNVHEQYKVSRNSQNMVTELNRIQNEIHVIDSLIQIQISRESEIKTGIVEALYIFADSSQMKPSKVEIGEKVAAGSRNETGISVSGTGTYAAMGRFVESIENYPRSTRIRQIVLKSTEKKSIEGFVDFVLME